VRALLLSLCVVFLAGCGGNESGPLLAKGKVASVQGTLQPDVHLFAEPVVAQVDVVVDRDKVDPADVTVKTDFKPYEKIDATEVTRQDIGRFTHLRYRTTLRCLDINCIPPTVKGVQAASPQTPELPLFPENQQREEKTSYRFPPVLVTAGDEPDAEMLGRASWPPLRSLSRINWDDPKVVGQHFPFVSTVTPLPKTTYRISPTLLGVLLLGAAVALVVLPLLYLVRSRRSRREPTADRGPSLSPLERALALVEWASRRPSVEERREALEALAYELDADAEQTASRARAQGWSPPSPEPGEMTELVAAVREDHAAEA
jgi:hypothetical protein